MKRFSPKVLPNIAKHVSKSSVTVVEQVGMISQKSPETKAFTSFVPVGEELQDCDVPSAHLQDQAVSGTSHLYSRFYILSRIHLIPSVQKKKYYHKAENVVWFLRFPEILEK